ncbi:MAG TPA: sodium:solute symporter [Flavobacteriales bacterium]|nr:sodium:solute symporter [Flavobacteriales bacterium]HMR27644.1 sodium:solute symporter [Flavobacteriales bacterium]
MHWLDWLILLGTLGFIVGYGVWRTRRETSSESYLRGGGDERWWAVGLSVMATQASAITFLSTPGQGYLDGLGFVQFYFGLPLAMLVINRVFIPLYYKWKVYTAYEFIGKRFDARTRLLTAGLFLIQRGLAAGITIYAPSIILSKVLHWPLSWTCVFIGTLVILYTTTGGAKAVGVTHKQQMAVIFGGLFVAFGLVVWYLREHIGFVESLQLASALGKTDVIDTSFDPSNKYTLWSGLIGGFFLQLAYFGTDQSQVQRYLSGQNVQQAQRGLWMNALLKIPMQFFILLTGVLVFVFYLFNAAPIHWNSANTEALRLAQPPSEGWVSEPANLDEVGVGEIVEIHSSKSWSAWESLDSAYRDNRAELSNEVHAWLTQQRAGNTETNARSLVELLEKDEVIRAAYAEEIKYEIPAAESNDKDYIFITFIIDHMPIGIIGLLLAMIFSAGMSSTSAELSALATTSVVDVVKKERTDGEQVRATKWATVLFGLLALAFAALFSLFENLIQAVNIIGSLFYGTILGIFLVAFFLKRVGGTAVFIAALVAQATILTIHFSEIQIAFLWYNLIAPAIVVLGAVVLQAVLHVVGPGFRRLN